MRISLGNTWESKQGMHGAQAAAAGQRQAVGAGPPARNEPESVAIPCKMRLQCKTVYIVHPFLQGIATISGSFLAGGPAPTASLCPAAAAFAPRNPCFDVQLFPRDLLVVARTSHCQLATLCHTLDIQHSSLCSVDDCVTML